MKSLYPFLFFLVILIPFGCTAVNIIEIDSPKVIQIAKEFEVYINITPSQPIAGAQCNISFNKDVLIAKNITNGGIFEYWANDIYENFTKIDNQNGTISQIIAFSSSPTYNNGTFAVILFSANSEGYSWLNLVDAIISDEEGNKTSMEVINGSIFVDGTPPSINFYSENEFFDRNISLTWGAEDNYSPEEKIFYSYSFNGGNWSEWTNSNKTFYELDVGNYTFMLKAKDEAGNVACKNLSFSVRDVNPPEIKNVKVEKINNTVNISCDISDDFALQEVFLILNQNQNYSMERNNGNYFFNSSYPPGKYNYRIVAIDKSGNENISEGNFSINHPPNKPTNPEPANGATDVSTTVTLSWICSDADNDALTYDVYFGKTSPPPKLATVTSTSYNPSQLDYSTTYYWKIVAKDGQYENSSDIWQFKTQSPPNQPPKCSLFANSTSGIAPLNVTFNMTASDEDGSIASWSLDVDNDGIAEYYGNGNPPLTIKHIYNTTGNYIAKLTVNDDKGALSTANSSISVRANISVDFDFAPLRPATGVAVSFFALVEGADYPLNYTWNFGDGSVGYERNVSHALEKEGKYRVRLNVSDGTYYYEKNRTVEVVTPDFYVEAEYFPEKPKKGDEIKIFFKIKNDGGYSENVTCHVFLDEERQSFIFNISEEYEKEIYVNGISRVKIFVDPSNEIEEKNEKNNEFEISIKYGNNLIYLAIIPALAIPTYFILRKKKIVIEEEKVEKCSVCLGSFKEEENILKCDCGALYHKSCARRIKNCINCGKKL